MKLYKLLKDTPTIKAGTTFKEVVSDFDGAKELARITPIGAKTNPQWTVQDINDFGEWFEEVQGPTDSIHWKPKIGDDYWIIYSDGDIDQSSWSDHFTDFARCEMGRIYRTKEECEKARDRELAEARLRRTSTFKPDFKDGDGGWAVCYYHRRKELDCIRTYSCDSGEPVHYKTYEDAQRSIKENRKDWLTYLGIEDRE